MLFLVAVRDGLVDTTAFVVAYNASTSFMTPVLTFLTNRCVRSYSRFRAESSAASAADQTVASIQSRLCDV